MKTRNTTLDLLRGLAIIFVVWGHSIQNFAPSGSIDIFDYPMFDFIYSFHMPLLMLVSGYLFFTTSSHNTLPGSIKNIITRITIPHITWAVIITLFQLLIVKLQFDTPLPFLMKIKENFFSLWFLCALVYCYLIVLFVRKFLKDSAIAYLLIFILISLIPVLGTVMYVWMYPYFIAGYWIHKEKEKFFDFFDKYGKFLALVLFPIMVVNWATSFYVYTTGIYLTASDFTSQLFYNTYRLVAGFAGCGYFYILAKWLAQVPFTGKFQAAIRLAGRNSLAIYMVQTILVENFLGRFIPDMTYSYYLYTYGLCFIMTILITSFIVLLAELIKKSTLANRLLLGGR